MGLNSCVIFLKGLFEPSPFVIESNCTLTLSASFNTLSYSASSHAIFLVGFVIIVYLINYIWIESTIKKTEMVFDDYNCLGHIIKTLDFIMAFYWLISALSFTHLYFSIKKLSALSYIRKVTGDIMIES
ncbi:hypothetical protein MXB_1108, partial [Myxobolus squamalis]